MNNQRGYFGIGIFAPKREINTAGIFRSALAFGADFVFTIGETYQRTKQDTNKSTLHIPLWSFKTFEHFMELRPKNSTIISVETENIAVKHGGRHKVLKQHNWIHDERSIYILGREDTGLDNRDIISASKYVLTLDTTFCLNVATMGSIVLFDRYNYFIKKKITNGSIKRTT